MDTLSLIVQNAAVIEDFAELCTGLLKQLINTKPRVLICSPFLSDVGSAASDMMLTNDGKLFADLKKQCNPNDSQEIERVYRGSNKDMCIERRCIIIIIFY